MRRNIDSTNKIDLWLSNKTQQDLATLQQGLIEVLKLVKIISQNQELGKKEGQKNPDSILTGKDKKTGS